MIETSCFVQLLTVENSCILKPEFGTLHGFVLHWSDVFKARWGDIPVLLHLLLLLTVRRATDGGKKQTDVNKAYLLKSLFSVHKVKSI